MYEPFFSYRFHMDTSLRSLVGSASINSERAVPGGQRLYFEYENGTITYDAKDAGNDARIARIQRPFPQDHLATVVARKRKLADEQHLVDVPKGAIPADEAGLLSELMAKPDYLDNDPRPEKQHSRQPYLPKLDEVVGDRGGWHGLSGDIVSSGDWAIVREDGILALDARFTIKTSDEALISVVMSGTGDLRFPFKEWSGDQAYKAWLDGQVKQESEMPISVSLRFSAPGPLRDQSIPIAARYLAASRHYRKYVSLGQGTFVGTGVMKLGTASTYSPDTGLAKRLILDVYEILAPGAL